jgi:cobalt/nickel transport system permease protein
VSALGVNIINMAFIPAFLGYGLYWLARRLVPATRLGVLSATALAAFASVLLAAAAFALEYAIGGNDAAPIGTVAAAMVGVHLLIGVGEAAISTLTVGAVLATRADLVYGARDLRATAVREEVLTT